MCPELRWAYAMGCGASSEEDGTEGWKRSAQTKWCVSRYNLYSCLYIYVYALYHLLHIRLWTYFHVVVDLLFEPRTLVKYCHVTWCHTKMFFGESTKQWSNVASGEGPLIAAAADLVKDLGKKIVGGGSNSRGGKVLGGWVVGGVFFFETVEIKEVITVVISMIWSYEGYFLKNNGEQKIGGLQYLGCGVNFWSEQSVVVFNCALAANDWLLVWVGGWGF